MNLDLVSAYSTLLPLIIGVLSFRRLSIGLKWLGVLILLLGIFEAGAFFLSSNGQNNLFLFHGYTFVEFTFLTVVFRSVFEAKWLKHLLDVVLILFWCFSLVNLFAWESLTEFNSNQRYVQGVITIVFCLLYMWQLMKQATVVHIERDAYFWLASGCLIYFAGTMILFLVFNHVAKESLSFYWNLHSFLNIFLNVCYAITLWLGRRSIS